NEDGRILEHSPGNTQTLTLPPRQFGSTFPNQRLVTTLGFHNEVVRVGDFCGPDHIRLLRIFHPEGYVVENGVVEKYRLLGDHTYLTADRLEVVVRQR